MLQCGQWGANDFPAVHVGERACGGAEASKEDNEDVRGWRGKHTVVVVRVRLIYFAVDVGAVVRGVDFNCWWFNEGGRWGGPCLGGVKECVRRVMRNMVYIVVRE